MRLDLTTLGYTGDMGIALEEEQEEMATHTKATTCRKWIARPKTLRLATRSRPPLNSDGSRSRNTARISKSSSMPSSIFSLVQDISVLAEKLVEETLLSLFRKLHPEKSGWNLTLVNLCATNMSMAAREGKAGAGRDIGTMLKRQEDVLKDCKIVDVNAAPSYNEPDHCQTEQDGVNNIKPGIPSLFLPDHAGLGSDDALAPSQGSSFGGETWDSEGEENYLGDRCHKCGATMPSFAMVAHERFHFLTSGLTAPAAES